MSRSFFTSTIYNKESSFSTIDNSIKKLDLDLRRMGRISKYEIEEVIKEINTSSGLILVWLHADLFYH